MGEKRGAHAGRRNKDCKLPESEVVNGRGGYFVHEGAPGGIYNYALAFWPPQKPSFIPTMAVLIAPKKKVALTIVQPL